MTALQISSTTKFHPRPSACLLAFAHFNVAASWGRAPPAGCAMRPTDATPPIPPRWRPVGGPVEGADLGYEVDRHQTQVDIACGFR
jgi:hypothetical protein